MTSERGGILSGETIRKLLEDGEMSIEDKNFLIKPFEIPVFAMPEKKEVIIEPENSCDFKVFPSLDKLPNRVDMVTFSPTTSVARTFNEIMFENHDRRIPRHPLENDNNFNLRPTGETRATLQGLSSPAVIKRLQHMGNIRLIENYEKAFLDPEKDIEKYLYYYSIFGNYTLRNPKYIIDIINGIPLITMTVNTKKVIENDFAGYRAKENVEKMIKLSKKGNFWKDFLTGVNPSDEIHLKGNYLFQTNERLLMHEGYEGGPFCAYMLPESPDGVRVALSYDLHPEKHPKGGGRQTVEIIANDYTIKHGQKICYILSCRLIMEPEEINKIYPAEGNSSMMGKFYT